MRGNLDTVNILFTRFPLESIYGGAEVQTLSLMKGLRERGHEVMFLGSCPVLLEKMKELGMQNKELRIGDPPVTKWGAVSFLWRRFGMREKITNPLPQGEGNVICMLSLSEKLLLTDWAVAQGIRVFWIEHDRIGRWLRWNPWLPRLRRLSRLATTIVVSDLSKRIYVKELGFGPEHIVVIPNGIDVEKFCPRTMTHCRPSWLTAFAPQGDKFHIGCIARLSPEKGVDLLIEAIKDLPNVHLTIVGAGCEEDKLRRMIDVANSTLRLRSGQATQELNNSITLLRSAPNIAAFYRTLDIFVLPSRDHDPCPLAPIEAMACGIPVIMTDACGTAEYVESEKEAIIVTANSAAALREAILRLQNDTDLRRSLARCGPGIVEERFSMERMVGKYEKLLRG